VEQPKLTFCVKFPRCCLDPRHFQVAKQLSWRHVCPESHIFKTMARKKLATADFSRYVKLTSIVLSLWCFITISIKSNVAYKLSTGLSPVGFLVLWNASPFHEYSWGCEYHGTWSAGRSWSSSPHDKHALQEGRKQPKNIIGMFQQNINHCHSRFWIVVWQQLTHLIKF